VVLEQLSSHPTSSVQPYVYVFSAIASPPKPLLALKLVDRLVYLLVLVLSVGMLWRQRQSEFSEQYTGSHGG